MSSKLDHERKRKRQSESADNKGEALSREERKLKMIMDRFAKMEAKALKKSRKEKEAKDDGSEDQEEEAQSPKAVKEVENAEKPKPMQRVDSTASDDKENINENKEPKVASKAKRKAKGKIESGEAKKEQDEPASRPDSPPLKKIRSQLSSSDSLSQTSTLTPTSQKPGKEGSRVSKVDSRSPTSTSSVSSPSAPSASFASSPPPPPSASSVVVETPSNKKKQRRQSKSLSSPSADSNSPSISQSSSSVDVARPSLTIETEADSDPSVPQISTPVTVTSARSSEESQEVKKSAKPKISRGSRDLKALLSSPVKSRNRKRSVSPPSSPTSPSSEPTISPSPASKRTTNNSVASSPDFTPTTVSSSKANLKPPKRPRTPSASGDRITSTPRSVPPPKTENELASIAPLSPSLASPVSRRASSQSPTPSSKANKAKMSRRSPRSSTPTTTLTGESPSESDVKSAPASQPKLKRTPKGGNRKTSTSPPSVLQTPPSAPLTPLSIPQTPPTPHMPPLSLPVPSMAEISSTEPHVSLSNPSSEATSAVLKTESIFDINRSLVSDPMTPASSTAAPSLDNASLSITDPHLVSAIPTPPAQALSNPIVYNGNITSPSGSLSAGTGASTTTPDPVDALVELDEKLRERVRERMLSQGLSQGSVATAAKLTGSQAWLSKYLNWTEVTLDGGGKKSFRKPSIKWLQSNQAKLLKWIEGEAVPDSPLNTSSSSSSYTSPFAKSSLDSFSLPNQASSRVRDSSMDPKTNPNAPIKRGRKPKYDSSFSASPSPPLSSSSSASSPSPRRLSLPSPPRRHSRHDELVAAAVARAQAQQMQHQLDLERTGYGKSFRRQNVAFQQASSSSFPSFPSFPTSPSPAREYVASMKKSLHVADYEGDDDSGDDYVPPIRIKKPQGYVSVREKALKNIQAHLLARTSSSASSPAQSAQPSSPSTSLDISTAPSFNLNFHTPSPKFSNGKDGNSPPSHGLTQTNFASASLTIQTSLSSSDSHTHQDSSQPFSMSLDSEPHDQDSTPEYSQHHPQRRASMPSYLKPRKVRTPKTKKSVFKVDAAATEAALALRSLWTSINAGNKFHSSGNQSYTGTFLRYPCVFEQQQEAQRMLSFRPGRRMSSHSLNGKDEKREVLSPRLGQSLSQVHQPGDNADLLQYVPGYGPFFEKPIHSRLPGQLSEGLSREHSDHEDESSSSTSSRTHRQHLHASLPLVTAPVTHQHIEQGSTSPIQTSSSLSQNAPVPFIPPSPTSSVSSIPDPCLSTSSSLEVPAAPAPVSSSLVMIPRDLLPSGLHSVALKLGVAYDTATSTYTIPITTTTDPAEYQLAMDQLMQHLPQLLANPDVPSKLTSTVSSPPSFASTHAMPAASLQASQ